MMGIGCTGAADEDGILRPIPDGPHGSKGSVDAVLAVDCLANMTT
jgi:hypothetical protein